MWPKPIQPPIFKTLNCYICSIPYSKMRTKGPHSPLQMKCGVAICRDCSYEKRTHGCRYGSDCESLFEGSRFYLHLFYKGFLTKTTSGYTMAKIFSAPSCCNCSKKFQLNIEKRNPIILKCGHLLCVGCLRNLQDAAESYEIVCPTCKKHSIIELPTNEVQINQLKYFLNELPGMQKHFQRAHRLSFFESILRTKSRLMEAKARMWTSTTIRKFPPIRANRSLWS